MESFEERRRREREPYHASLNFTALCVQTYVFQKIQSKGEIIDASNSGIGIITDFPLQMGHVVEWDDKHEKGKRHIAVVKWAREDGSHYRAGLMFI